MTNSIEIGTAVKLNEWAVSNGIGKRFHGLTGTVVSSNSYLNNGSHVDTFTVAFCESGKSYGRRFEETKDAFEFAGVIESKRHEDEMWEKSSQALNMWSC
jgi:hypothetical protein